MNTGVDFQQEPPALKRGQPRIFATGNGQDPQPRSTNGPQPSSAYLHGNQPQQEPLIVYNSRTGDIKGKGVDRSGIDPTLESRKNQQQPGKPLHQRDNQTSTHDQASEIPIRTVYTEAMSPAMQYRATLEKERNWSRAGGRETSANRPTESQLLPLPNHRVSARRATEPHFEPSPPAPLRKDSSGSSNELQQRFVGPRAQSVDQQQSSNLNGDGVTFKLDRRRSLYSPVVAATTNTVDTEFLNKPPISPPKSSRSFGQRSDSIQLEPVRYHSPPTPSSFNTESSPPATNDYSSEDISASSREPQRNLDPRRQPGGWNVQSSTTSLSTQDSSRKASFASNTSIFSDRERNRSPAVAEPQPSHNRAHKSTQPSRLDKGQTSPPPTHQSRERSRTGAAQTNRGSHMDSFYGGDASLSGMKRLNMINGERTSRADIDEEPEPYFYPLELHLLHPQLFRALLHYLSFYDWCVLQSVSKSLRSQLGRVKELKEEVLERYLSTIGYARWNWEEDEPLVISLRVKSSWLSSAIALTSMFRISVNTCVVFRCRHMSAPESQKVICKRGLPRCRKRRR